MCIACIDYEKGFISIERLTELVEDSPEHQLTDDDLDDMFEIEKAVPHDPIG
jgi:hypothetical protein